MPIQAFCPGCNHLYVGIDEKLAGRRFTCKQCGRMVPIPSADGRPAGPTQSLTPPESETTSQFNASTTQTHKADGDLSRSPAKSKAPAESKSKKKPSRAAYTMHPDDSNVLDLEGPAAEQIAEPEPEQPRVTADAIPELSDVPSLEDQLPRRQRQRKSPQSPGAPRAKANRPAGSSSSVPAQPDLASILAMERAAPAKPVEAIPNSRIAEAGNQPPAKKKTLASDLPHFMNPIKEKRSDDHENESAVMPWPLIVFWFAAVGTLWWLGLSYAKGSNIAHLIDVMHVNQMILGIPGLIIMISLIVVAFKDNVLWGVGVICTFCVGLYPFVIFRFRAIGIWGIAFVILTILGSFSAGVRGYLASLSDEEMAAIIMEQEGLVEVDGEIVKRDQVDPDRLNQPLRSHQPSRSGSSPRAGAVLSASSGDVMNKGWTDVQLDERGNPTGQFDPAPAPIAWKVEPESLPAYQLPIRHKWSKHLDARTGYEFEMPPTASRLVGISWRLGIHKASPFRLEVWDPYDDTPVGLAILPPEASDEHLHSISSDGSQVAYYAGNRLHLVSTETQKVIAEVQLSIPADQVAGVAMPGLNTAVVLQSDQNAGGVLHIVKDAAKGGSVALGASVDTWCVSKDGRYLF